MKEGGKFERDDLRHWYLLIHQLPPKPLYLRAKIHQRLADVGAVGLKRSVYVLPRREDCLEDFQSIAQEAAAGGGEAYVCEAQFLEKGTDSALLDRFRAQRDADYRALAETIQSWSGRLDHPTGSLQLADELPSRLARTRKRFDEIARVDFFAADGRKTVERLLEELDGRVRSRAASQSFPRGSAGARLSGRTWVTRRGIQVDRIASAWLVRRFVDGKARFRFMDPRGNDARPGELSFDIVGGDFTHEGDRCTFETLLARTGVADPALEQIAEIVHDVDLKDGKFERSEAPGVERILIGLVLSNPEDAARLERGMLLFDELYQSFRHTYPAFSKEAPK